MNHYPKHVGDYLKKTLGLTMLQDGAYNRAIDLYYIEEGPLPLDPETLFNALRCHSKAERDAVKFILAKFFTKKADGYHHGRCDAELVTYREKSAKASKSASARWGQKALGGNADADAIASKTHSDGNANHKPLTSNQGEIDKSISPEGDGGPSPAGLACMAIKQAGMVPVNPSHPDLLALLAHGVTAQQLGDLAAELYSTHGQKPMSYVLTAMKNRIENKQAFIPQCPQKPEVKRDAVEFI